MKTSEFFAAVAVMLISAGGYVANIVHLIGGDGSQGLLIARACGIFFPPLGVILGFV